ncbi:TonB-dependent receptor [Olivibacter domesticus]|uniref:Outer membrane protein beta-barrel family protein n=1 Tax=Olivibacter domesticus TaxID=407022 RepID=A0A1H7SKA2_OLID1|nr:TonB-dependent receptor [Olivibacter domesticus]SEL72888.1 Outer membrane protein beta-barrel family protein [Olivibacter domesticus]
MTSKRKGLKKTCCATHIIVLLVLGFCTPAAAQTGKSVNGVLRDSTGLSVIAASVKLISSVDTLQASSDVDGRFTFKNVKGTNFNLFITSLGFRPLSKDFSFDGKNELDLQPITMGFESKLLDVVNVTGGTLVTMKEDTIEYNAKDYRVRPNAMTEELIKKLDGVEVDKDGNVQAQGESVARVRINGKDFFGGDVKTATKNLPADIIEKIQIVDDYGDQANLTGNRTGEPEKVLNITIAESNNNGNFGQFGAGIGTKPDGVDGQRYQVGGMYNSFTGSRQFSVLGNMNNNNNQAFDFNTRGGGARRMPGGGGRRMGGGFGGSGGFGSGSNGLTDSYSLGFNYRKDFNDKLTTYGNYSYNHSDNTVVSSDYIQDIFSDEQILRNSSSNTNAISNNHRFDWNVEYKPNEKAFIKLSPTLSIGNNNSSAYSFTEQLINNAPSNNIENINNDKSFTPSYGMSGLFNYKLNEKGRNVFLNFSLNSSKTEQDQDRIINTINYATDNPDSIYQKQLVDLNNKGFNGGSSISYIEPLTEKSNLEFSYDFNFANYDNDRQANSLDILGNSIPNPSLSNQYDYSFITHKAGLTYRYRTDKIVYQLGGTVLPTRLKGHTNLGGQDLSFGRSGFYFIPVARFEYKVSRTRSFNVEYRGNASEPSFSQLQPVTDISNPQFPVTGNPNLAAEFNHTLSARYRNFDFKSGNIFFAVINANMTQDKIATDRISYQTDSLGLVQETRYLNTSGNYNARGFYHYAKPFNNRKYVVSLRGSANFNNNVAYANSIENVAKNWVLMQGINVQVNPKDWLELRPGIDFTYNTTKNSLQSRSNQNISTWAASMYGNIFITPTLLWNFDVAKTSNNGYVGSVQANPLIINTFLEKQFFKNKNGMLRLQAFDLLNEQVNVSRTVVENRITDSRTNRLARYFMLSFTYRFQKFAGKAGAALPEDDGPRRWDRGDRPMGGGRGGRSGGF